MDWTKYVRVTLGLTQKQIAGFLDSSRSNIAQIESGRRSPSLTVIKKLTLLHQVIVDHNLSGNPPVEIPVPRDEADMILKNLTTREQESTVLANKSVQTLETLTTTYKQCMEALPMINLARFSLPSNNETSKDTMWIDIWEAETYQKLTTCSISAQHALQLRISALQAEAATAKQLIASLPV